MAPTALNMSNYRQQFMGTLLLELYDRIPSDCPEDSLVSQPPRESHTVFQPPNAGRNANATEKHETQCGIGSFEVIQLYHPTRCPSQTLQAHIRPPTPPKLCDGGELGFRSPELVNGISRLKGPARRADRWGGWQEVAPLLYLEIRKNNI